MVSDDSILSFNFPYQSCKQNDHWQKFHLMGCAVQNNKYAFSIQIEVRSLLVEVIFGQATINVNL